jgi:hypothetical protein
VFCYRGYLSVADGEVPNRADLVLGVDYMAALQKEIILNGLCG